MLVQSSADLENNPKCVSTSETLQNSSFYTHTIPQAGNGIIQ